MQENYKSVLKNYEKKRTRLNFFLSLKIYLSSVIKLDFFLKLFYDKEKIIIFFSSFLIFNIYFYYRVLIFIRSFSFPLYV